MSTVVSGIGVLEVVELSSHTVQIVETEVTVMVDVVRPVSTLVTVPDVCVEVTGQIVVVSYMSTVVSGIVILEVVELFQLTGADVAEGLVVEEVLTGVDVVEEVEFEPGTGQLPVSLFNKVSSSPTLPSEPWMNWNFMAVSL